MRRQIVAASVGLGLALAFGLQPAAAQKGEAVKAIASWKGRITAEQAKLAPKVAYIVGASTLKALWKDWKIEGDAPKVDFEKNFIVFAMNNSSGPVVTPRLDKESGDLVLQVVSDSNLTVDYGYQLVLIPRAGIKTIGGKAIEKQR
jgi:hypothetical protein